MSSRGRLWGNLTGANKQSCFTRLPKLLIPCHPGGTRFLCRRTYAFVLDLAQLLCKPLSRECSRYSNQNFATKILTTRTDDLATCHPEAPVKRVRFFGFPFARRFCA